MARLARDGKARFVKLDIRFGLNNKDYGLMALFNDQCSIRAKDVSGKDDHAPGRVGNKKELEDLRLKFLP